MTGPEQLVTVGLPSSSNDESGRNVLCNAGQLRKTVQSDDDSPLDRPVMIIMCPADQEKSTWTTIEGALSKGAMDGHTIYALALYLLLTMVSN